MDRSMKPPFTAVREVTSHLAGPAELSHSWAGWPFPSFLRDTAGRPHGGGRSRVHHSRAIAMIRRAENVPRGFRYPIRSEWGSSILNGLPRLVERGGNYADLFGIERAGMGVNVNKTVHSPGHKSSP